MSPPCRLGGMLTSSTAFLLNRICVGIQLANRSVFINTALLMWSFNIEEDPAELIDNLAFTNSVIIHPLPFKVMFKLRHENVKLLVDTSSTSASAV